MRKQPFVLLLAASLTPLLTHCGGGGSSSTTNADGEVLSSVSYGYTLPSEISAVPAESNTSASLSNAHGLVGTLSRVATALSDTSDYHTTKAKKFVEEKALEQFSIIEQVLNAVSQTNYSQAAVINKGPYTAMVAWIEEKDGRELKTLEPWVVDSRMIVINNQDVNRVLAWIEEPDWENPGQTHIVKAEFKIYQEAQLNSDGSFADYGEWDLNVAFNADSSQFFAATSRISGGLNTINIHEKSAGKADEEMKGILVRSGPSGYGKVSYPNWDWCWTNSTDANCTPPATTAQYAYNSSYLVVDGDISDATGPTYKDRTAANAVEITHRYGMFYTENPPSGVNAGDNVEKYKTFGFPIRYTAEFQDGATVESHAYYGSWQGRHEIWGSRDSGIPAGTTVTRDNGPGSSSETYVTSDKFNGTFTKRSLTAGDLSDIQDIPVETWINKHWDLTWNETASEWKSCAGWIEWGFDNISQQNTLTCRGFTAPSTPAPDIGFSTFNKFDLLANDESGRKSVNIGRWDQTANGGAGGNVNYLYNAGDGKFYVATQGQMPGQFQATTQVYMPTNGDNLWVDIGGSIYIQYAGFSNPTMTSSGWIKKNLTGFIQQTWTPEFGADATDGSAQFDPEVGREYYINNNGSNFIVRRTDAADAAASYDVKKELQQAANPVNLSSFVPAAISYFRTPWRPEVRYTLSSTAGASFMKLLYANDDPNTPTDDTGTVYTSGEWGLQGYNNSGTASDYSDDKPVKINSDGTTTVISVDQWGFPDTTVYTTQAARDAARPTEFNWEYSTEGWGTQQFLCTPDCSVVSNYLILDDPIQLSPFTLANRSAVDKSLSLQFDGWMHGVPDLYFELSKNNFHMTSSIADKVINIPGGTEVTDTDGVHYYVKPLETSIFLAEVPSSTAGVPDISDADLVDLATVPDFTDHGMGAKPAGTTVLYSEGIAVE